MPITGRQTGQKHVTLLAEVTVGWKTLTNVNRWTVGILSGNKRNQSRASITHSWFISPAFSSHLLWLMFVDEVNYDASDGALTPAVIRGEFQMCFRVGRMWTVDYMSPFKMPYDAGHACEWWIHLLTGVSSLMTSQGQRNDTSYLLQY